MDASTNDSRETGRSAVLVGVDGTRTSLDAVRWAAAEAQLRGLPLRILHAAPYAAGHTGPLLHRANDILARAFTVARRAHPDLEVTTERTERDPVPSLLDASRRARLVVVGMGGGEWALEAFATSVGLSVCEHAACPVAVIHAATGDRGTGSGAGHDVVVGVQDPAEDAAALDVAFADARRHGDGVVVLHAGHRALHEPAAREAARARLTEQLAPWTARHPDVPVRVDVVAGQPAGALLTATVTARAVVVGTRSRGAVGRVVHGSTCRQVLRHSPVPVIVVDPEVTPEPDDSEPAGAAPPGREPEPRGPGLEEPRDRIDLR